MILNVINVTKNTAMKNTEAGCAAMLKMTEHAKHDGGEQWTSERRVFKGSNVEGFKGSSGETRAASFHNVQRPQSDVYRVFRLDKSEENIKRCH